MNQFKYDQSFMSYTANSSYYSAKKISRLISEAMKIKSVLDIGCALGTWLKCWREVGIDDVTGVDGDYVTKPNIVIPESHFLHFDISQEFDLNRKFDLVQSLEVGEHISLNQSEIFIENIARHADPFILLSTAPPGQGGENHVNEQPYSFWKRRLEEKGFLCYDCIRPIIKNEKSIQFWYRYNLFLYVHSNALSHLPDAWKNSFIEPGVEPRDISPKWFKLRKSAIRLMPRKTQDFAARLKSRLGS